MIKLDMTTLSITRVDLRNKEGVVIMIRIRQKVIQDEGIGFHDHCIQEWHGIVWHLDMASDNSDMYNVYYSVLAQPFDIFRKQFILLAHAFL